MESEYESVSLGGLGFVKGERGKGDGIAARADASHVRVQAAPPNGGL